MLAGLREVLEEGRSRKIAVGSFNTTGTESLWAVLEAAEEYQVPVIIAHAQCHEPAAGIDRIGPCMVEAAKRSTTRVCVHLDHGENIAYCKKAIALGFTSVMIDRSADTYEENSRCTREVTEYAHAQGVDVEAELGQMGKKEDGAKESDHDGKAIYTNPDMVPEFLEATGADALAIAFGTAHGIYRTRPALAPEIITRVREHTQIPLVMHGGSGISDGQYREVIRRGINKINYYTYMSYAGYAGAKAVTDAAQTGYFHDIAAAAQKAMKEDVRRTIRVFSGLE